MLTPEIKEAAWTLANLALESPQVEDQIVAGAIQCALGVALSGDREALEELSALINDFSLRQLAKLREEQSKIENFLRQN